MGQSLLNNYCTIYNDYIVFAHTNIYIRRPIEKEQKKKNRFPSIFFTVRGCNFGGRIKFLVRERFKPIANQFLRGILLMKWFHEWKRFSIQAF